MWEEGRIEVPHHHHDMLWMLGSKVYDIIVEVGSDMWSLLWVGWAVEAKDFHVWGPWSSNGHMSEESLEIVGGWVDLDMAQCKKVFFDG